MPAQPSPPGNAAHARSYLFVPADRPERFDKALAAGAHAVIVDLEDAVPPAAKPAARSALAAWLSPERPVLVRVNSADTEWYRDDLEACRHPGVAGIVLPKAEEIDAVVGGLCSGSRILIPLIETARGFARAATIAACTGVQRLVFGTIDFQIDLGIDGDGEELLHFRSGLVLVSRLANLRPPVDGVCTAFDDAARLAAETRYARRLGFGAKLCIHPKQVAVVNGAFAPTEAEIAWARRVTEAARATAGAAVAVDGRMVDRPVLLKAEAILTEAGRQ